jgi:hypothetical protein
LQVLADDCTDQPPEIVSRVRIVSLRRQRGIAGKASKDEKPRILARYRRQSMLYAYVHSICLCGARH